ncbi:hypothetical protein OHA61_38890 [Streptomyces sp. NBC_00885]|uniref:hypothetical protein n=1 Tax=Streptomyces sp. NBC_00885 TaxID=2975857 RepID=UPI00386A0E34|nr:hypothetical protein OHA61_38890 [Streptomyces sp. NBC_00885]
MFAIQRITAENTTLKQRVRQLTTDNRTLEERLKAARSNLRFQDRRVAGLEVKLVDPTAITRPGRSTSSEPAAWPPDPAARPFRANDRFAARECVRRSPAQRYDRTFLIGWPATISLACGLIDWCSGT